LSENYLTDQFAVNLYERVTNTTT